MRAPTLDEIRAKVILRSENWHRRLLTPDALARLAKDLGLGWFTATDIAGLWKIGLLRADLVISDVPMDFSGLKRLTGFSYSTEHTYCDFRRFEHRPEGYGSVLQDHRDTLDDCLLFHPFRVYVLHHVKRTLEISTSNMQYLTYQPGILKVVQHLQERAQRWTSSIDFGERFHYWNQVAETSAVVEPMSFEVVFRDQEPAPIGSPPLDGLELTLRDMLIATGKTTLRQMLSDLAFSAENLDDNRSVHVLLRLMKWRERERLKGQVGCAMHFLAMAEIIRRAAEQAFIETWPEEDKIGPGRWFPNARKMLYGTDRVFDGGGRNLRDYLTQLGLDFGIKVRCYVEGDTEYGALAHAVGNFDHVQLVNLAGSVAERGGRGLAFAKSLEADMNSGVFSVVILDGDREEYLRMLRRAAEDARFHGRFFISEPDIECGNFSASELIETAIQEIQQKSPVAMDMTLDKAALQAQASKVRNNGDLDALFKEQGLAHFRKSESWGKSLMKLAIAHPAFPTGDARGGQKRSIVEAAELLIRMRDIGFSRSVAVERLDSRTGRTVALTKREP